MLFTSQSRVTATAVIGAIILLISAIPISAQEELYVQLGDTSAQTGSDAWVSVFLANYTDTLAGFSIHIIADQPGIIEFQTDTEDTLNFPGGVDTAGTAISGWQYVNASSFTHSRSDIKVVALANMVGPPTHPGLPPQESPVLLMRLRVRTTDTLPFGDDVSVGLHIVHNLSETGFSDPYGNLIGTKTNYNICDTTYWRCLDWYGDTCLAWEPSTPESADSVRVDTFFHYWCCDNWDGDNCLEWVTCAPPGEMVTIDSSLWTSLDSSLTYYGDGVFTVTPATCCEVPGDIDGDGQMNVGDPVFLINFIFRSGIPLPCPQAADVNGDCLINVADVVTLIRPIFQIVPWEPPKCGHPACTYEGY